MQDNPSEASTPRSLAVDLPVEKAPTPPPKTPTEVPSLQSPESDIYSELPPESVPLPPSEISPSISSASRDLESEHIEETPAPPPSIVSSGELSMSLPTTVESSSEEESSRMPTVSSTESSEFVMSDLPVSEESLPSPAPLARMATTESSPSIHPSQWAPETDISYESSQLQPTPLTQSLQIQDERDTSFETSVMRPSVSPLTSFGSLTAITETITTSAASTPPPPPSLPPSPPPPLSPSPPPLPATVIQTVISPLAGRPLSLSRLRHLRPCLVHHRRSLVSLVFRVESVWRRTMVYHWLTFPPPSEVSTEPSLLSSLHSSSISSVHYSPQPTRVPPPEFSLSDHSPAPSPSVSSDTPQTNQPSIHSVLETVQTQTHTERTEVITHEIDRLLHHIHELDHLRSQERHEISENIRIIRDELYDLSEYVRTHLVETEGVVVPERPEPPAVSHRDQSVVAISERRDQSVAAMTVVSEPRITPVGPRSRHLIPIPLTPPPVRSPSTRSTSSSMSLISFLSSHHSDDFSLLDVDEVEVEMHPPSPAWPSEPSSPSSGLTPSIISSSEPSPGPTLSLTSSSSSPTPPPSSPTLSTGSTTSSDSSVTARQVPGITLTTIRDMLAQVREQTTALWEGQAATNHVLDELRQSRPVPQDDTEIFERLHHIQALIETLIDARQVTTQRDRRDRRDHEEAVEETETIRIIDESTQRVAREGSVTESDSQTDVDSLLSRWRDMVRGRDRAHIPIQAPVAHRAGPSLDEQLMELLNIPPAPVPSDIQPPPQLIPFVYQPAPRPSRSRSTSPVLRRDSAPPFRQPTWTPETLHPPIHPPPRRREPIRQPRAEQPTSRETPPIPGRTHTPRPEHATHDVPPPRRQHSPGPERRPSVRPPGDFLPGSLYDHRPGTAPGTVGGREPPPGPTSWYRRRPEGGIVPPPGAIDGQPGRPGAQAQGPAYVPMPPGPTVVQLPLFDTLMAILREHRLAQLATVDQQRELMRYMGDLNDWLARDVQDRQAELRGVTARVDQLREDLGRFGVGAGPGMPMPQPQPQTGQALGGFIIPQVPPAPGGPIPPVIPPGQYPGGFFPLGGPQPPVIPGIGSPGFHSPVIPEAPPGWVRAMPEPSEYVTGPVLPPGAPYGEYHPTGPSQYVHHIEEPDERVIPSTPSSGSRSPLPPSPGRESRSSTPTQDSYYPPHSPRVLPVPFGDVPHVVPVEPSVGPPQQTIINVPQTAIPPPGHIVGPGFPVQPHITIQQPGVPIHLGGVPVQPSLQGVPTGPIVIHPPPPGPAVPVSGSIYLPSRASSRTSTRAPVVIVQSSLDRSPLHVPASIVDPLQFMHSLRFPRLLVRHVRIALVAGHVLALLGTIHPGMRVAFGDAGTAAIADVLTHTHQMMDTPAGDITPLGTKIILGLGIATMTTHLDVGGMEDIVNTKASRERGRAANAVMSILVVQMIGIALRGRKSEKIQAEPLPGAHPALAPVLIGTQKNVMLIDHAFKTIADVLTPTHQMMDTPAGDTPLGTKIIYGLGIADDDYSPGRGRYREYEGGPRERPRHERRDEHPEGEEEQEDPGRAALRRTPSARPGSHRDPEERDADDRPRIQLEDTRSVPAPVEGDTAGASPPRPPRSPSRFSPPPPTIIRAPVHPASLYKRETVTLARLMIQGKTPQNSHHVVPLMKDDRQAKWFTISPRRASHSFLPDWATLRMHYANDRNGWTRQNVHWNRLCTDAHDADGRREREFRDNEDDRERIFLDNEERRDAETRQRGDALFDELEERIATAPPLPVRPPQDQAQDQASIIESIHTATQDAASRHASDILDTVRMEREEMAREREALAAERERERAGLDEERRLLDEEREAKIAALEEDLARTRTELDDERQLRMTEADEARMAAAERDEALRNQLADLTNMIQQNQALCEEKRALMEEHWAEKQRWKEERDGQMRDLMGMVSRLVDEQAAAREREEEQRQANEGKPGIEQVMEELQRQNAEQRELLNSLSESWRADSTRQHQETINAVRATANEQVPYNVQGYLDEFSKALAAEVRMLLGEVGKLREERRNIQHELGYLLMLKAKYGPGGEFDSEWKPPMAPGAPPPPPPPPDVPAPEDMPPSRPAWRTVQQRSSRRSRKRQEVAPEPPPEPRQAHSWVTWQPNPALAPTPPSVEPTLLVPDRGSPGLFGPRSPRDSFRG
ncbi:hypothetical protein JVT61DRAFT_8251 [Boletus reticuloceps]|uniref:Uncharacterized protein n=1 Tax=Boletus reticuloceps TaxID=495285 RepID=A0A8I2YZT2_9AGAM|nr:hypothetical protein JVT61DRAFT_8251 [Boletus reticuloceps]